MKKSMNTITQLDKQQVRRQALLMTGLAMVVVYIIWNVPFFSFIAYPLRLFVTYVHEAGHSLAALLTGGQVIGFTGFF